VIVGLQPLLPATDVTGDIQLRFDSRNLCATRTFQRARLSFYILVCRNDDPTHPPERQNGIGAIGVPCLKSSERPLT
jgi:hypothetical protein